MHAVECPEGLNENLALIITGLAIAAGLYVVYREITLRIRKRKKRDLGDDESDDAANYILTPVMIAETLFWTG